jgi:hypothetical protein
MDNALKIMDKTRKKRLATLRQDILTFKEGSPLERFNPLDTYQIFFHYRFKYA